ncbi:hypothetical protein BDP55DRAFT_647163 [Colletotrichum godetiae]|uniref:Uncharacterized protein n=1 Tax=Colletotrichum godetiae TaxID=1209918 RepID=A0AAJ0F3E9_9PEZI|nr:uncharacterized protein BDP55DRAFT_647163 [Colletotrichum godetiae]KAK1691468.1 hypothetical protein BDP55DRAFT_647163 [Colletotrichum godetiae]
MRKMGCLSLIQRPKTKRRNTASETCSTRNVHPSRVRKRPRRRKRNVQLSKPSPSTFTLQSPPVLGYLTSRCRVFTVAVRLLSLPCQRTLRLSTRQHCMDVQATQSAQVLKFSRSQFFGIEAHSRTRTHSHTNPYLARLQTLTRWDEMQILRLDQCHQLTSRSNKGTHVRSILDTSVLYWAVWIHQLEILPSLSMHLSADWTTDRHGGTTTCLTNTAGQSPFGSPQSCLWICLSPFCSAVKYPTTVALPC